MNWLRRNWQWLIPTIGILIVSVYLFAINNKPIDPSIPGGGLKPFFATILFMIAAYRTTDWLRKAFFVLSAITFSVWFYPDVYPIIKTLGPIGEFINNIYKKISEIIDIAYDTLTFSGDSNAITALVIFMGLTAVAWIKKSKVLGIFALLLLLLLGWNSISAVYNRISKSSASAAQGSGIISSLTGYVGQSSAQKASELRERVVKNGSTFYNYNGTNFIKKDVSANEEFIKVFLLGESVQKDGLTFEKVRIGDPATGEDAWVYSGILLSSPTAKPTAASSTAPGKAPEWELVKDCPIPLSGRIFSDTVGPNGERAHTGEVYSGCFVEIGYDYKITYSGKYSQWFTSDPWFNGLTWKGWNPQSQIIDKPFSELNYGALALRIGNKECLHPEGKKDFIIFTPSQDAKIFSELNISRDESEYHHPKVGSKIKNSTLSIKLERRPL